MRARLAATLRALTVAALVAGCGSEPASEPASVNAPPAVPHPPSQTHARANSAAEATKESPSAAPAIGEAAIGALVKARADALAAGRPAAYARTATGSRRRLDAADARRARRLGVRAVRVVGLGLRVRDRRATASVRLSYRLKRVAGRWNYAQTLRLRGTGGGWRVTSLRPRAPRPPWELADYVRSTTRHFTVFTPAGLDRGSADLGDALERAYATIRERLPGRPRRRYPVIVAADFSDMAAMTTGIRDVGRLSAITDLSLRTAGVGERVTALVGVRILIPWPSFVALDQRARERVLTHELAHAVLAPATSGRTPAWLQEGIALYVSGDRRTDAARAALATGAGAASGNASGLGRLARPDAMAPLAGHELSAAYALSSSTAYYVADRYGPGVLLELLAAFGDEKVPGRPGRALAHRVTRRVLGIGVHQLERDVVDWVLDGAR